MPECPLYKICEIKESDRDPIKCRNYDYCTYYRETSKTLNGIGLTFDDTLRKMDETVRTIDDTLVQTAFMREHRKELF